MEKEVYKQNIGKLVSQRNCFLLFSFILSAAVTLLSTLLFFKRERTIIVPTIGSSFWIEENQASGVYLEKMGLFLSDLLFNRSPSDVEKKNQIILEHAHPAFYQEIQKSLILEKNIMQQGQKSFFFNVERSYAEPESERFITEGEFIVFVGKKGEIPFCAQHERKRFTLHFHCQNGKLQLTSLKKETL